MTDRDINEELFEIQAQFARVMAHPARLRMLYILKREGREVSVSDLLAETGIGKTSLSQHLTKMETMGVLRRQKRGRFQFVTLAHPEIGEACELMRKALERQISTRQALIDATSRPSTGPPWRSSSTSSELDSPTP